MKKDIGQLIEENEILNSFINSQRLGYNALQSLYKIQEEEYNRLLNSYSICKRELNKSRDYRKRDQLLWKEAYETKYKTADLEKRRAEVWKSLCLWVGILSSLVTLTVYSIYIH
jgi:adenine-specific DNA methylase